MIVISMPYTEMHPMYHRYNNVVSVCLSYRVYSDQFVIVLLCVADPVGEQRTEVVV